MSFRIEKKYLFENNEHISFKSFLFKNGMEVLYPKRIISSCYYDTKDLIFFHQSNEGILPRSKVRIRWYDNKDKYNKEIKVTSVEGRFKTTEKFTKNNFKKNFSSTIFDKQYGLLKPSLLITYSREYYNFKKVRLTFDTNIKYVNLRSLARREFSEKNTVMELKAPSDTPKAYLEKILSIPTSRFSKYSFGILLSSAN